MNQAKSNSFPPYKVLEGHPVVFCIHTLQQSQRLFCREIAEHMALWYQLKFALFISQNILEAVVTISGFCSIYTLVKVRYLKFITAHLFQFLSSVETERSQSGDIALFLSSFAECQALDDHLCIPEGMLRQVKQSLCVCTYVAPISLGTNLLRRELNLE